MSADLGHWLRQLEVRAAGEQAHATLWPRTPVLNIQAEIWRRVGATDYHLEHPDSRAGNIVRALKDMQANELLPDAPAILDIFCGDGVVLWQIARALGRAECYGVDLRAYPEHIQAKRAGVEFCRVPAQTLVAWTPPESFDVAILLNTFRGWERADLPEDDRTLPGKMLAWLRRNARYVIVTATAEQVQTLRNGGWWTFDLGRGEDDTRLVGMFLGRDSGTAGL